MKMQARRYEYTAMDTSITSRKFALASPSIE
jgi:hypothetical protein